MNGQIGKGWALEPVINEKELFAIRELRILLQKIFDTRKGTKTK